MGGMGATRAQVEDVDGRDARPTGAGDVPDGRDARPTGDARPTAVDADLAGMVEAILFTASKSAQSSRIADAAGLTGDGVSARVEAAIERLNAEYDSTGRAFRIERVAGGWRVLTRPEYADAVASFLNLGAGARLSRAAVETLSIIAYRQPIARAELESIRGVACGEVLRSLLERRLIEITGRAEEVGRPMLYGTTRAFLEQFGLASVKDLPPVESIEVVLPADPGGTGDIRADVDAGQAAGGGG